MPKLSGQYTEVEIDPNGGCMYFQLSRAKVARTLEYTDLINIDLDKKNSLVGIEFVAV